MLANFSVQNFRSIKDKITLSFEATKSNELEDYYIIEPREGVRLLKLGMIYGANASGKTNVLKALDFLRDLVLEPADKKTDKNDIMPFLFDEDTPNKPSRFSIEFYQKGIRYLYELELNNEFIVQEELRNFNPNKAVVFKRITDEEKQLSEITFGSKIDISKRHKSTLEANTLWNNSVLGGFLKTNIESEELQEIINWFKNILKPIVEPRTDLFGYVSSGIEEREINKTTILEVLKKADFNISDIIIEKKEKKVSEDFIDLLAESADIPKEKVDEIRRKGAIEGRELYFKHEVEGGKEYKMGFDLQSAGTQRYYQFGGLLDKLVRKQSIFPVDEFESSLHPDLLKHFLLSFLVNSKESQLIVTTHLRELLMEQDIFRKDAIWFTEKKEDGSTDLYSLDDFDTSVIRKSSSIYNAYKAGKLGATPNLSDYYLDIEHE